MATIRAVTFDLDDTLWWANEVLERAEISFYKYIKSEFPKIAKNYSRDAFWEEMLQVQQDNPDQAHNYTFLRKKATLNCALSSGVNPEDDVDQAFNVFITERSRPVLFPGVLSTLNTLKSRGLLLGAITNGNFDIEYMPELKEMFDFCVSAEHVGLAKPHAAPFARAFGHFSTADDILQPGQIVHIGDDYTCDIQGAKEFGMKTIWVKHSHTPEPDSQIHADATIDCITSAIQIIDQWVDAIDAT